MKITSALALILSLLTCTAFSKDVSVDGGSVTFVVPDNFTELSSAEINAKFPSFNAPTHVVGNKRRTTTVAYQLKEHPVKQSDLPDVQKAFTQVFERVIPGLEWKQNTIAEMAGQKWIVMEITSHALDQDIHNIVLITSHKGQMLMFNFNSTKTEFPKMEKPLRESIQSIVLTP